MGYGYTGAPVGVTLKKAGRYKLEVWGAQGGYGIESYSSLGGYSTGILAQSKDDILYVYVGGAGKTYYDGEKSRYWSYGGWNGGGDAVSDTNGTHATAYRWSTGGGASDISTKGGTWDSTTHLYSRIIVAGGGGGFGEHIGSASAGSNQFGGVGGGMQGGRSNKNQGYAYGGTQTSPGVMNSGQTGCGYYVVASFGKGGSGCDDSTSHWTYGQAGGGGGWYGGAGAQDDVGAGGGSGYIYNSASESSYPSGKLVNSNYYLTNAEMYMYGGNGDCVASTATATKTTCTNSTGAHVANAANTGNGYAKITYLGT